MRDTLSLLGDLVRDASELISVQGRLLKAEMREAGEQAKRGVIFLAVGAVLALIALGVLAAGAVLFLIRHHLSPDIACGVVGAVLLIVALIFVLLAGPRLRIATLIPNRTLRQVSRTLEG